MVESKQVIVELIKKRDDDTRNYMTKMFELEEAKEDARIMAIYTSVMSPPSTTWWKKRKDDIVVKTMPESGSSDCYLLQKKSKLATQNAVTKDLWRLQSSRSLRWHRQCTWTWKIAIAK